MTHPGIALAGLALVATLLPGLPADGAGPAAKPRPDYGFSNDQMGVLMETTTPTGDDPHEHVRFRRHGGLGQRQVRIFERQLKPRTPITFSKPVKLDVGEKVAFTTVGAMPCAPARRPLKVGLQMRVRLPGRDWWPWFTFSHEVHLRLDC